MAQGSQRSREFVGDQMAGTLSPVNLPYEFHFLSLKAE
jgi:hypothetical protein